MEIMEQLEKEASLERIADKDAKIQQLLPSYIKYILFFNKLEESYDQLVQPQKRRLLGDLLVSVAGRLLEIKHLEIANTEFSDFGCLDDLLLDLKLNPKDIDIHIPKFIMEERKAICAERERLLANYGSRILDQEKIKQETTMTLSDAILRIQTNERGRQGSLRAKFIHEIRMQAERERLLDSVDNEIDVSEAALTIQRVWRGYLARKAAKQEAYEEQLFLGMTMPAKDPKNDPIQISESNAAKRRLIRQQYEEEYQQALVNIKEKFLKNEGPDIRESIQDTFRQWYMNVKKETGKFPEFPSEEEWRDPTFKFGVQKVVDTPVSGNVKPQSASSKKSSAKPEKKKDKQEEKEDEFSMKPSEFVADIKKYNTEYLNKWYNNPSDKENFQQKHDPDIIKADKRLEVEAEIKDQIFKLLEDELANLKMTLEKDKGKKKKGKKEKKPKGKKGKKEKDLTANRTMESLIEELATSGILQRYQKIKLSEYLCEHNFMAPVKYEATSKLVVEHSLQDIRRLLTEYVILPLGFQFPRTDFPFVKSLLLVGAKGTGKTMMVNALANELGAAVFNLTPRNTADSPFQGKANVVKMIHMVFKVARELKPAIVYIDNAEMVFAKKVPKDDASDPKRIKKDLAKALKTLKSEDRIIVIGTTNKPWDADKGLASSFEKVIYIPKPDYGTRFSVISQMVYQKGIAPVPKTLNLSVIAKMTENYSLDEITDMLNSILTNRRIRMLTKMRPLSTEDFIGYIRRKIFEENELEKPFKDWMEKLPQFKKRQAYLGLEQPEEVKKKDDKKKK
ncbi:P-loop containing nucleoside triphosphate hydrolase protein [Rozella allomycis CSF55]|uniref:P-loop containing nucleoside triphosphate hydrolase protein n=1 Tax=Rozella allomycis (strain CSF55) TaxID=988480 RepID=A0A075AS02_ROZAC|nr:P-loop containing nucleoside triphosphate hydrolase domain-containing protein [Rozella allomycis CSF55]RKP21401.1 P-loop containing nucleoside triphosphate hydrolase protein [Rozella allomycis CSF55]|eukprot:EPZ33013.1 P-loop containing nucleoside triphosphate hydrolase domain-containing protein [Rozella allomycis CSF55]